MVSVLLETPAAVDVVTTTWSHGTVTIPGVALEGFEAHWLGLAVSCS